jgi:hypothetical protein
MTELAFRTKLLAIATDAMNRRRRLSVRASTSLDDIGFGIQFSSVAIVMFDSLVRTFKTSLPGQTHILSRVFLRRITADTTVGLSSLFGGIAHFTIIVLGCWQTGLWIATGKALCIDVLKHFAHLLVSASFVRYGLRGVTDTHIALAICGTAFTACRFNLLSVVIANLASQLIRATTLFGVAKLVYGTDSWTKTTRTIRIGSCDNCFTGSGIGFEAGDCIGRLTRKDTMVAILLRLLFHLSACALLVSATDHRSILIITCLSFRQTTRPCVVLELVQSAFPSVWGS